MEEVVRVAVTAIVLATAIGLNVLAIASELAEHCDRSSEVWLRSTGQNSDLAQKFVSPRGRKLRRARAIRRVL